MFGKIRHWRWLIGAACLALAECACVAAVEITLTGPAQAQFRDDGFPFLSRQRWSRPGGFFGRIFRPSEPRYYERERPSPPPTDYSHAPPPHKPDAKGAPVTPTATVVVMGDSMADWLAYGLEDAFSDSPEVAIVRKNKIYSGLLRYEAKSDLDWWHVARDILAQEKPNYVVMMLGVSDRQNIRERDVAKEADKQKAEEELDKTKADPNAAKPSGDSNQSIVVPEPPHVKKSSNGTIDFRSDQWAAVYSKRIDETIAALKSRGVPVFWVGLPSIRGTKSTADASYLNDLYRARAERAGVVYIDVWDGFVDESGKYTSYGPDYEGQMRRLRSGDGVFFTKAGARKLAHYVEREIRRYMSNRGPIALPAGPIGPVPADAKSTVRPVAGPVVPLTVTPANSEELLGGASAQPVHSDATANRVLVKGEPVPAPRGRADDFIWPPGSDSSVSAPAASVPAANAPTATTNPAPAPAIEARTEPPAAAKPKIQHPVEKKAQNRDIARQPAPIRPSGGLR
ncbi:MAG: SGNH/GDSL hydrolase family protein [Pseudolabrys sp.]